MFQAFSRKCPGNFQEISGKVRAQKFEIAGPEIFCELSGIIIITIQASMAPFIALKTIKIRKKYGTIPGTFPTLLYKAL